MYVYNIFFHRSILLEVDFLTVVLSLNCKRLIFNRMLGLNRKRLMTMLQRCKCIALLRKKMPFHFLKWLLTLALMRTKTS